jgi:hypothetical protein
MRVGTAASMMVVGRLNVALCVVWCGICMTVSVNERYRYFDVYFFLARKYSVILGV